MSWTLALEIAATVAGLAAAGLWFRSATLKPVIGRTASAFMNVGGDGDQLIDFGDSQVMWVQNHKVGMMNAWAAGLTGLATVLQLAVFWLAMPGRPF